MSLGVFFLLISVLKFTPSDKFVYLVSFLHEVVINTQTEQHTLVLGTIYASLSTSYNVDFFQKDHLHSTCATTITVGSSKRSLDVAIRGILRLSPHHVFSMHWVWAPMSGSTKFRLWLTVR